MSDVAAQRGGVLRRMHRPCLSVRLLMLCVWLWGVVASLSVAHAQLVVEITSGADDAVRVAVAPFHWQGQGVLPLDVAHVINDNLNRSAQFTTLARQDMLSRPFQRSDVFFRDWRVLDVQYLVIGRVSPLAEGRYTFEFELFDVLSGELLKARKGSANDLRYLAHHISDVVYEALTGVKGVFATQIIYLTVERDAHQQALYRLQKADADGLRAKTLLTSKEPIMSPAWSPDGKQVAYVSFQGGRPGIYMQNIYSGEQTLLTQFKGINGAPDWSPDGQRLAMALSKDGNVEIYVLDIASRRLTRMTRHFAIDTEPRWSQDGKTIVFTSDRPGSPQIYALRVADRQLTRLTYEGRYNARGQLSPDGSFLAMVHRRDGVYHIAVQDMATGTLRVLTQTELDESPTVAPNGAMLMYATQEGNTGILSAVSVNGKIRYRIPAKKGDVREPVWSPFL